jgi:hypothetical protein
MEEDFNKPKLIKTIQELPLELRIAFATGCAQRLFPYWAARIEKVRRSKRNNKSEVYAQALSTCWNQALNKTPILQPSEAEALAEKIANLIPGEKGRDSYPYLEQAGLALYDALLCSSDRARNGLDNEASATWASKIFNALWPGPESQLTVSAAHAAGAAEMVYEAVYSYVNNLLFPPPITPDGKPLPELINFKERYEAIFPHPLLQNELKQQRESLCSLANVARSDHERKALAVHELQRQSSENPALPLITE